MREGGRQRRCQDGNRLRKLFLIAGAVEKESTSPKIVSTSKKMLCGRISRVEVENYCSFGV